MVEVVSTSSTSGLSPVVEVVSTSSTSGLSPVGEVVSRSSINGAPRWLRKDEVLSRNPATNSSVERVGLHELRQTLELIGIGGGDDTVAEVEDVALGGPTGLDDLGGP